MRIALLLFLLFTLNACTSPAPLSLGLVARMDVAGAQLNRSEAIAIINDFRTSKGVKALTLNAQLNEKAQQMAQAYAQSGSLPNKPVGISAVRTSAGYTNFAQTFSGWRNAPSSASALIEPSYNFAGLGVFYSPNSINGTYWVLLLDDGIDI